MLMNEHFENILGQASLFINLLITRRQWSLTEILRLDFDLATNSTTHKQNQLSSLHPKPTNLVVFIPPREDNGESSFARFPMNS